MERFRVGLATMVLLLSCAGYNRADYVFPWGLGSLGNGAGRFSNPQTVAGVPPGSVLIVDALNHRIQVFVSGGIFISRFSIRSSGYGQAFESGDELAATSENSARNDWRDPFIRQASGDGTVSMTRGSFAAAIRSFHSDLGVELALQADLFIADVFDRRSEASAGEDPLLASFGSLGNPAVQPFQAPRAGVEPSSDGFSYKLGLSLALVGIAGLATLGYVWRQRKTPLHRNPGGRRPISPYRSPSLPIPRGTISSPPPK
jgi:hypothetical protein